MLRPGKATAAKDSYRHLKIAPEFLAHDIGGHFGSAKNGMQALVDGHAFVHAIQAAGIVVALVEFDERQIVGPITVDLIRARKTEWRFPAEIARRHQHVHGAQGIHVEVFVGNGRRFVVGRLRGGVNDELRPFGVAHLPHGLPVADIDGQVPVTRQHRLQFAHDRIRRPLLAEELPAHIVVDPHNLPAFGRKLADAFRTDQPARSCDKSFHSQDLLYYRVSLRGKPGRGELRVSRAPCGRRRIRCSPTTRRRWSGASR